MNNFERWWTYYRSLKSLTHNIPGIKQKAEKAWDKLGLNNDPDAAKRVYENTLELARYDLKRIEAGDKIDRWPHGSTYLNQGYFEREIDSYDKICESVKRRYCHCGQVVSHKETNLCQHHYSMDRGILMDELRDYYKKNNLKRKQDESRESHIDRMKQVYMDSLKKFI